jgi:hypothetical protein
MPKPDEPVCISLIGDVLTDGAIIYVNGMDLAEILRSATPSIRDLQRGQNDHGLLAVTITRVVPKANSDHA